MQADFAVELGPADDRLEVPWASADGKLRYFDLKRQPELLLEITEARHDRELAEFLVSINSANSILESAKCDTWLTNQLAEEDEIYGATWKFASYVDVVLSDPLRRTSFHHYEEFAREISHLLSKAPDFAAAVEFIIRRCYYHTSGNPKDDESLDGFGITIYLYGYGDDEAEARQRWSIGLKVLQNALLQLSAKLVASAGETRQPDSL